MWQDKAGTASEDHVEFDENGENGLLLTGKYLPEELLSEILFHVDHKTLLNCQLVCKRWHLILRSYVWRKKAESVMARPLHYDKELSWILYYLICAKKPFEKNLIKNHSGKNGKHKYWNILRQGGHKWAIESPPQGVPDLPNSDPVFEGQSLHCFVTSFQECSKQQSVDLVGEGFCPELLDQFQPPIVISEWYSCRWDCPAEYECSANLINKDKLVLDNFHFKDILVGEKQNMWHHVEHEFTNYGPGLRKVTFCHQGKDRSFWAGHYGSKMAGACVKVKLPKQEPPAKKESSDPLLNL